MHVNHVSLTNFRSWQHLDIDLDTGKTVFVGRNGFGKTNVLEALTYIGTLGSHRVSTDSPLIRAGCEAAKISATVRNSGRELTAGLEIIAGRSNKAFVNDAPRRRPRDVLGILQSVMFAPEDLGLVRGEPSGRRKFLDDLAITRLPRIAAEKADYDRVLRQRSALLKTAYGVKRRGGSDAASMLATLDVWDDQLSTHGSNLLSARMTLVELLAPFVEEIYERLAPGSRPARIRYMCGVTDGIPDPIADVDYLKRTMLQQLSLMRDKEIDRGVCLVGPHRDDLELLLGDQPAKGFASHGESWSYALTLRLASLELLRSEGSEPVLFLDDVFAELDVKRRAALADVADNTEQVLITAAVPEDLPPGLDAHVFEVGVQGPSHARVSRIHASE